MRKIAFLSIILIVFAMFFVSCGKDKKADAAKTEGEQGDAQANAKSDTKGPGQFGLASMKAGSWAQHSMPDGGGLKYEYLGEDTWNGETCLLMETEMLQKGESMINQMWISKATNMPLFLIMKQGDQIMRLDTTQRPGMTAPSSIPRQGAMEVGKDKYTTPKGKKVAVKVYKMQTPMGEVDSWMSDEVPFWSVKNVSNGQVMFSLEDFGSSGATRSISKEEAENAQALSFPQGMPGGPPGGRAPSMPPGGRMPGQSGG